MAQTTIRRCAAPLADPPRFGADRRTFPLLRIALSLAAALFVGCIPEPDAPQTADEAGTEPVGAGAPAPDATPASCLPRDARSPAPCAQRDSEPPPIETHDSGRLSGPDAGSSDGGSAATDSARASEGGLGSAGSANAAPASEGGLGSDGSADATPAAADGDSGSEGGSATVAACYSAFSFSHPAVQRQREVFRRGDYAARPGLIEELAEASAAYPDEEQFALLAGLMRLWRIVEPDGFEAIDVLDILDTMDKTEQDLQRAYALCPTDHRIAGWLGPLWILLGRMTGDDEMLAEGAAVLQRGAERYPDFVTFTWVAADAVVPASDPAFQRALDAIDYYRVRCNGNRVEGACIDGPIMPHSAEAMALYFGDTLAKAQDREGALAWYTGAMQAPAWSSWPFRDRIEQRIQSIDQRIAGAATPDTSDDAPFWDAEPRCLLCHRE